MGHKLLPSLYDRRLAKDFTQTELASIVGITAMTISSYENGLAHPSVDVLYSLAKALGCSPVDLLIGQIQHFWYRGKKVGYGHGQIDPWLSRSIDAMLTLAQRERPNTPQAYALLQHVLRLVSRVKNEAEPRPVNRRGPRKKQNQI